MSLRSRVRVPAALHSALTPVRTARGLLRSEITATAAAYREAGGGELARSLLRGLATGYITAIVNLLFWSVAPVAIGWNPSVVVSGSMMPALSVGDVVVFDHDRPTPKKFGPGRILLFDDAAQPGRRISHRVYKYHADGTITTKGDANAEPDGAPVTPGQVHGGARLVIPTIGRIALWRYGQWQASAPLLALAALSVCVVVIPITRSRRRTHPAALPAPGE